MVFEVSHNWIGGRNACSCSQDTAPLQTDEKHPGYEKKNESKIVPRAAAELVHDKFVQKVNATAKQWYSAQDMLITGFLHESLPAEFALLSRSGSTGWTVNSEHHFGATFFFLPKK
jgi:hypothetical protein